MPRYFPDFEEFKRIAATGVQVVPVWRTLLADCLTPVTAFELLGDAAHAFLLESVVITGTAPPVETEATPSSAASAQKAPSTKAEIGRYSFIATGPRFVYEVRNGNVRLSIPGLTPRTTGDPLADMERLLPKKKYHHDKRLPSFTGGLVGYAGYDLIRYYEGEKLNQPPNDDRGLPDLQFGLYGELVVFDHLDKTIKVVANADVDTSEDSANGSRSPAAKGHSGNASVAMMESAYRDACARADALVARLQRPFGALTGEIDTSGPVLPEFEGRVKSNMTRRQFEQAIEKGKEYIRAGDIFQFVPSQRLRVQSKARPFDVYRALRVINPSPFMFYLKSPQCVLIGASPEILCRVQDGEVTSRPLAGTRRRGLSEAEDKELERELLADPKERAEHVMLVDLHRNDIGRVAVIGTVKVTECMFVERYSHVMHIKSNVSGMLEPGKTALDALRVSLPVGTVSGAPKIRAMQIIDELEPTRRGPYGGAVGYLDFSGNMDTCIALRTIVWMDGVYDVQSGAGIVADSVPALEWEETMNKAKALLKAVEIAERGF